MTWEGLTPPYRTIVADPPWPYPEGFGTVSATNGKRVGPLHRTALPYSSLTVDAIRALPVTDLVADDARLFLWATNRYLGDAFTVLDAWEFCYRQTLVWHKRDGNMGGSVAASSAEFLLVAVKGAPPVLTKAASSVITTAAPKRHSQKPDAALDLIATTSPGPYVELFARSPRLGWDSWGHGWEQAS